eukprot:Skav236129  [mRNA]  locus=scaffold900:380299:382850:- [translate_table: standard]
MSRSGDVSLRETLLATWERVGVFLRGQHSAAFEREALTRSRIFACELQDLAAAQPLGEVGPLAEGPPPDTTPEVESGASKNPPPETAKGGVEVKKERTPTPAREKGGSAPAVPAEPRSAEKQASLPSVTPEAPPRKSPEQVGDREQKKKRRKKEHKRRERSTRKTKSKTPGSGSKLKDTKVKQNTPESGSEKEKKKRPRSRSASRGKKSKEEEVVEEEPDYGTEEEVLEEESSRSSSDKCKREKRTKSKRRTRSPSRRPSPPRARERARSSGRRRRDSRERRSPGPVRLAGHLPPPSPEFGPRGRSRQEYSYPSDTWERPPGVFGGGSKEWYSANKGRQKKDRSRDIRNYGAAKAKAKAGIRRPAARGRAPVGGARDPVGGVPPGGARSVEERYRAGESVRGVDCPLTTFQPGDWIATTKGKYNGEEIKVAGKVRKVEVEGGNVELVLLGTGTDSEALLRYLTALDQPLFRAHLCPRDCTFLRVNPDLVHVPELQKLVDTDHLTWEANLTGQDELGGLRAEQEQWRRGDAKAPEDGSSTASRKRKKDKKEKKRAKKKELKERRKKLGGRVNATKKAEALYSGTGLDPSPKNRLLLKKKVKKQLKRSKISSSSGSQSSHSASDSEEDWDLSLLEDRSRIQRLAELGPGLLSLEAISRMKRFTLQASGTPWEMSEDSIPPLVGQYIRQACIPRAGAAMSRELLTLAHLADLLIQNRPAEALDVAAQRIKSLELTIGGQSWSTSQKVEIIPPAESQIAGRAELQLAQRETQLDHKARGSTTPGEQKGKSKGSGKTKDKGKEKTKDKGKGGSKEDPKRSS